MTPDPSTRDRILAYLAEAYRRNSAAEVSGQELSHELGLDPDTVRSCVEYLTREGLVASDLFPLNIWVHLTDEGAHLLG